MEPTLPCDMLAQDGMATHVKHDYGCEHGCTQLLPLVLKVVEIEDEEACWDQQTSYGELAVNPPMYGSMDGIPGTGRSCSLMRAKRTSGCCT